jgi:hypothetical protein
MGGSGCVDIYFLDLGANLEWSASRPGRFTPRTHWIGGCVDPRASLEDVEKILDRTGTQTPTLRSSIP